MFGMNWTSIVQWSELGQIVSGWQDITLQMSTKSSYSHGLG